MHEDIRTDSDAVLDYLQIALAADSPYEGTISSTILDYFDRYLEKVSYFDDYVLYRSGQYQYTFYFGDFTCDSGVISGVADGGVRLTTAYSSGSGYVWTTLLDTSITINTDTAIVYSNLGDFPALERSSDLIDFATLFLFCCVSVCLLVRPIFAFVMRCRR